jgi:hypothetical protein
VVHSESKRKGNLLLFGDFVVVAMNPWFDSESGHHYLKKPALGLVFCFLGQVNTNIPVFHHPDTASLFREYFYLSTLVKAEG